MAKSSTDVKEAYRDPEIQHRQYERKLAFLRGAAHAVVLFCENSSCPPLPYRLSVNVAELRKVLDETEL